MIIVEGVVQATNPLEGLSNQHAVALQQELGAVVGSQLELALQPLRVCRVYQNYWDRFGLVLD